MRLCSEFGRGSATFKGGGRDIESKRKENVGIHHLIHSVGSEKVALVELNLVKLLLQPPKISTGGVFVNYIDSVAVVLEVVVEDWKKDGVVRGRDQG